MGNRISYVDRDFNDYKNDLMEITRMQYPDLVNDLSSGSIAAWLMDINADIADGLSYHIDRTFQETNINTAQKKSSVLSIARTNGLKIPGPKGAMAEVKFSCMIPVGNENQGSTLNNPNLKYSPVIRRGTLVSSGNQIFELQYDLDFSKQFNQFNFSDRTIVPIKNTNNELVKYEVSKTGVVIAGETKIYSQVLNPSDIVPFMEITLPFKNVMSVESILVKENSNYQDQPTIGDFMSNEEVNKEKKQIRFFEVDSLSVQDRWGVSPSKPNVTEYSYIIDGKEIPACSISKGEWIPVKHKFITEYTDNGLLKVIFGAGNEENNFEGMTDFSKYQMSRMLSNNSLGVLPKKGSTIYILYRVGGGSSSNLPKGSITNISYLKADMPYGEGVSNKLSSMVKNSIKVTNTTPSVSGKDAPSVKEIINMIKYNNSSYNRCVTVKDYKYQIERMPSEYGAPYKVGVIEENNKVMIYLLGIDYNGNLSTQIPKLLIDNISNYLEGYRMINDFIEIKTGKIINVGFDIGVHVDKNYKNETILNNIKDAVWEFMKTDNRDMGDDVYVSDIRRVISNIDGVKNIFKCDAINFTGGPYSDYPISQTVYEKNDGLEYGHIINLNDSEEILNSDSDSMLEVKNKDSDIIITIKSI